MVRNALAFEADQSVKSTLRAGGRFYTFGQEEVSVPSWALTKLLHLVLFTRQLTFLEVLEMMFAFLLLLEKWEAWQEWAAC